MVTVYVTLIINNRKTIDQVPSKIRQAVIDELTSMGLGVDGKPLPKEEEEEKDIEIDTEFGVDHNKEEEEIEVDTEFGVDHK